MKQSAILGILALLFGFGTSAAPAPSPQDSDLPSRTVGLSYALNHRKGCYILCEFIDPKSGSIQTGEVAFAWVPFGAVRTDRILSVRRHSVPSPIAVEVYRPGIHVLEFISPEHARMQAAFKIDRVRPKIWTARVELRAGGAVRLKVLDRRGRAVPGASARLIPSKDLPTSVKAVWKEVTKVYNREDLPKRPEGLLLAVPSCIESLKFGSNTPRQSDADGNLLLQGLLEGKYRFEVSAPDLALGETREIEVRENRVAFSEIRLDEAHRVVVEAVSERGKGIEGLVVDFDSKEQRLTDAAGLCRGALPAGDAVIEVRGFGYRPQELRVKIRPGENRVRVVMKPR